MLDYLCLGGIWAICAGHVRAFSRGHPRSTQGVSMERKRNTSAPDYRLPTPHDPWTGQHASLTPNVPLCRFSLYEALTISDATGLGTLLEQWGPGVPHSTSDRLVLYNPETATSSEYFWDGEEGDVGLARWDESRRWIIITMDGLRTWKPNCRFAVNSELTMADEWIEGTIEVQYGQGRTHTATTAIFHNLLRQDTTYEFYADSGDHGIGGFDRYEEDTAGTYGAIGTVWPHWFIHIIECP